MIERSFLAAERTDRVASTAYRRDQDPNDLHKGVAAYLEERRPVWSG